MRAGQWCDGVLEAEEVHTLTINLYELVKMMQAAGFADVEVQGDHNDAAPTRDDDFLVFVAEK